MNQENFGYQQTLIPTNKLDSIVNNIVHNYRENSKIKKKHNNNADTVILY